MSALHLQRVVVRMLYDPELVAQVFADPATALQDVDLTAAERTWLVQADRRAYAVDPLRRARTLTGLIEEFPVSVQNVVQQTGQLAVLDAFFGSPAFHACIQQRGSLALALGAYLGSPDCLRHLPGYDCTPLVQIETALAHFRRQTTAAIPPAPGLTLAPTATLLTVPAGTLLYYHAVLECLQGHADGLVPAACMPFGLALPAPTADHEWLLVIWQPEPGTGSIECLPETLGLVLAATPASRTALLAQLCTAGADEAEAVTILEEFIADGILQEGA